VRGAVHFQPVAREDAAERGRDCRHGTEQSLGIPQRIEHVPAEDVLIDDRAEIRLCAERRHGEQQPVTAKRGGGDQDLRPRRQPLRDPGNRQVHERDPLQDAGNPERRRTPRGVPRRRPSANGTAAPIAKSRNGNTRSASVQPFHGACSSHGYTKSQLPGVLTRIIAAIVRPRNTSSESSRRGGASVVRLGVSRLVT
jgi:hypothetical protein